MKINIQLNKNFVTKYNALQGEYGTEIASLNGFGDEQLSYTDFISNFIDEQTVADSSIDGNSNVSHKDIVTLEREMPKPHSKLLAFNKIYYEIQKKYGFKAANEWLEMEWMGKLYMHDANSSTFRHYCYKDDECMVIKYNNEIKYISFKNLYNLLENNEDICFDITINQDAFFPSNLYVLDLNDNKEEIWTKITRVVKHNNEKPMRFIKYGNGLSQIVTEDHPIITRNGEKKAKYITEADEVYTQAPYKTETAISESYMTKDFGWLVGICLSEASTLPSEVRLKQNEKEQYNKIISVLQKYNMPYTETTDNRINIRVSKEQKFLHRILNNTTAINKQLPPEHIYYPDEFMDGIVAGMIDGDGTIDGYKNRHCQIRIASEILCHQLSNYLQTKGVFCGDRTPYINNNCKTSFTQKLPIFGIGFSLTKEKYFSQIGSIKIKNKYQPLIRKGNFKNKQYQYEYGWVYVIENEEYIESCNEVYDITTETGHFLCNGVLSHNCYAYDLKDLAEKGLYFIDGLNGQPAKHLITFVDFIKEFVSFACNRSSGAVGLPNVIPYMFYFWKKDVENDYLGIRTSGHERYYADQAFQRFIYAVNQPYVRDRLNTVL